MKTDFLNYNGHGMIERFPRSMSQTYVVGHEMRHKVHNRLNAISRGETVSQSTSFQVTLSNGVAIISKGVTRSHQNPDKSSNRSTSNLSENTPPPDTRFIEESSRLNTLKTTKRSVEKNILFLERELKKRTSNPGAQEEGDKKRGKAEAGRVKKQRLRNRSVRIDKEISSFQSKVQIKKSHSENGQAEDIEIKGKRASPAPAGVKEEFTTLRQMNEIINNSFIFMHRNVPGILLNDGVGSTIQTQSALQSLKGQTQSTFLHTKFTFHSAFAALRTRDLQEFENRLSRLDSTVKILANRENFKVKTSTTSNPESISFKTSFNSPEGTFSVGVTDLARGGQVVSDRFEDPFSPLNLSGSFTVNGYSISVSSSDSLNDLVTKINFGEDSNRNGRLDFSEDINGNGAIDTTLISGVTTQNGYSGSLSLFEDVDFDGALDPSEDLNNNLLLDGGSEQTLVSASIERNRLTLRSISANDLSLSDDTGILRELGFFTESPSGRVVRADRQLLDDGTNLNQSRKRARLSVNNTTYRRESNEIDDIIPSTKISIKKESSIKTTLTIQKDFSELIALIKRFKESYNNVLEFINDQELSFKMLDRDPHIQNARSRMIQGIKTSKPELNQNSFSADKIGIHNTNQKRRIAQLSVTNLAELVRRDSDPSGSTPFVGQNSLLEALEKAGASTRESDKLTVDEKRLNRSLKNNFRETISLLTGKDGISSRIKMLTESFLNKATGVLRLQQEVANIYAANQGILRSQQMQQSQITSSRSEKTFLNSVISKGV